MVISFLTQFYLNDAHSSLLLEDVVVDIPEVRVKADPYASKDRNLAVSYNKAHETKYILEKELSLDEASSH